MLFTQDYSERGNQMYFKLPLPGYNSTFKIDAALPLWSTKSLFDKEYLQVELLADREVPLEKTTDDILNMNTYTCYICDTEVPKSYTAEHNDGNKHKTCLKIADLALERTRKHMKLEIRKRLSIQVRETYFCEPCAIVVQKVDRIDHESSDKHVKSMRHDEILKDFLMIYEDKENIELITEKIPTDVIDLRSDNEQINCDLAIDDTYNQVDTPKLLKENEIQQAQLELGNDSEILTPKASKTDIDKVNKTLSDMSKRMVEQLSDCLSKYSPEKGTMNKAEKKENSQKATNQLNNYLKSITDKCKTDPIHTVQVLTNKQILITAINGDKIKVPVVNFHSIHNKKENSYCKICEDPNVGISHEQSEEHMEKIMIAIEDKNAIRKIDDIWSHCILCNDLTKNINFHLQSVLHRNKLKHCLVDSGTDINDNLLHKPNTQEEDTSQLIQEHSLLIVHDSEITCNICDVTIPNTVTSIKDHVKTFVHVTNYNATIDKNKLSELDDLQYYCMPCDMCVVKRYALGHCNGKKHNKHLNELINKQKVSEADVEDCTRVILPSISQQIKRTNPKAKHGSKAQNNSELICFVCNIVLYNIQKHMNSLKHKRNYFSYLEANKLNEIEEDTFYCIPCNTVILIDYLMSHCTSKKHKTHLKNLINNADIQEIKNQSSGQLIAENSHLSRSIKRSVQNAQAHVQPQTVISQNGIFNTAIPLKHLYQFQEMSNTKNLLCTLCDEEVVYRKCEVQAHVSLIDHVVSFNLMMLWNQIKRLDNKYYCNVCKVDITYFNELSHVGSAAHVSAMSTLQKGTVYVYDKMLLTLEHAMSHKVGDRVRPSSIISIVKPKVTRI